MVDIIPRLVWGARYVDGQGTALLPAKGMFLHHSVTSPPGPSATLAEDIAHVRLLESIGQSRFGVGISYTFIIMPSGRVFEGHSVDRIGTHTGGYNTTSRAICLAGNYQVSDVPGTVVESAAELLAHGFFSGWWTQPAITNVHRDVRATTCPGDRAVARVLDINRRASEIVAQLTSAPAPAPKSYTVVAGDTLGTIASRFGVQIESLIRINGIENPNRIFPGQVLYLEHQAPPPTPPAPAPTTGTVTVNLTLPVLRRGSKGHHVLMIQSMINTHGIGTTIDGDFGPQTEKSVYAFQRGSGLASTGIIDARDWKQLLRG